MSKNNNLKTKIDIERLVSWALIDQGLGWEPRGGDSMAGLRELGTKVDVTHSGGLAAPSIGRNDDNDAFIVKHAIDALPREAGALVVRFGRTDTRPDWGEEGYGEPEQLKKNGKLQWIYRDSANCRGKVAPKLDWISYARRVDRIAYERATWTAWHEALICLCEQVLGALDSADPTGPRVNAQPWQGKRDTGPVPLPYGYSADDKREKANKSVNERPNIADIQPMDIPDNLKAG